MKKSIIAVRFFLLGISLSIPYHSLDEPEIKLVGNLAQNFTEPEDSEIERRIMEQNEAVKEAVMQENANDEARKQQEGQRKEQIGQSVFLRGAYFLLILSVCGLCGICYMERVIRIDEEKVGGKFRMAGMTLLHYHRLPDGKKRVEIRFTKRRLQRSHAGKFRIRLPFFIREAECDRVIRILYEDRKRDISFQKTIYVHFMDEYAEE